MIHVIRNIDYFDDIVPGDNYQIIKPGKLPKQGDTLLFMHKDEQKQSIVVDVATPKGLMKGYYHVHHVVKSAE